MGYDEEKRPPEPLVNWKRLRRFAGYPALAVFAAYVCYIWLVPAFRGFTLDRVLYPETGPLQRQARELGLTYEKVLAAPAGAEGQPVVWCVQNRAPLEVNVDGDAARRLSVSNYADMPLFSGNKHQACAPMLLVVLKAAPGRPVPVVFREAI
jgi:hypothetical protein